MPHPEIIRGDHVNSILDGVAKQLADDHDLEAVQIIATRQDPTEESVFIFTGNVGNMHTRRGIMEAMLRGIDNDYLAQQITTGMERG